MPDPSLFIPRFGSLTEAQARKLVGFGLGSQRLVVSIVGDSNAQSGGGTVAQPERLPGEQDARTRGLWSLSEAENVVPLMMPAYEIEGRINIDATIELGRHLQHTMGAGSEVLIVQNALGGTSFVNANWNQGDAAYERFIERTNIALSSPGAVPGFVWVNLGAIDQVSPEAIAAFPAAALAFIDAARGDLDLPTGASLETLPFVFTTTRFGTSENKAAINAHIYGLNRSRDYVAVVRVDDLPSVMVEEGTGSDDVHFGPNARRILGRRVAFGGLLARTTHAAARQFTDAEIARIDAIGEVAEDAVTGAEDVGGGATLLPTSAVAAGLIQIKTIVGDNIETQSGADELGIVPFPAVPQSDIRIYSTGATGIAGEVAIAVKDGVTATLGTNLNVVGGSGDGRGPVIAFPGTNAININTYQLPSGPFTILFWILTPQFPVSDAVVRRSIMGSQALVESAGWQVSLDRERKTVTTYQWDGAENIPTVVTVDQWWHMRTTNVVDDGVVGGTRLAPGRWYHVGVTYPHVDGAGALTLDINGRFEHIRGFPQAAARSIQIGSYNNDASFVGALDQIEIWPIALSPEQRRRRYLETISPLYGYGGLL